MEVGKVVFVIILYVFFLYCFVKKFLIIGGIFRIDLEDFCQYFDLVKGVKLFLDKLNVKLIVGIVYKLVCVSV